MIGSSAAGRVRDGSRYLDTSLGGRTVFSLLRACEPDQTDEPVTAVDQDRVPGSLSLSSLNLARAVQNRDTQAVGAHNNAEARDINGTGTHAGESSWRSRVCGRDD